MTLRLQELSLILKSMSLHSHALDVINLTKIADSRSNIVNILGFSLEEADLFNAIDPQKAFNIARWFKEWLGSSASYNHKFKVKDLIPEFRDAVSVSGDPEYVYDPQTFRFIDYILEDNSLYQKVKKKPLKEALEDFYDVILRKEYPGIPDLKISEELMWYDVGNECEITSGFLHNCGSLGEFGEEGELRDVAPMTMMVLKNKNKRPLAVMTVGRALDSDKNPHAVIINAAENLNRWPTNPVILNAIWTFARSNGYDFANIFRGQKQVEQTPGLNTTVIESAGFKVIDTYAETPYDDDKYSTYNDEDTEEDADMEDDQ